MSDPLKLLREYITSGKVIKEKDDYIIFGETAFLKNAKTNYLVWSKKDEYYTLESLYFFYKKRSLQHTAYVKEAVEKKIQIVTRADRKALEDYLMKEKLDKLPTSIDISAPIPSSVHISKLQSESDHADYQSKRPRLEFDESAARKPSERVLAMLDATAVSQINKPEVIRDLSKEHGLTKDKIVALRQKAMANKRNQIKSTEEDLLMVATTANSGAPDSRRAVDSSLLAGVGDLTQEARLRERKYRTRTTCLEASSKNFAKSVLPILQTVRAREDGIIGGRSNDGQPADNGPLSINPSTGYPPTVDMTKNAYKPVNQTPGYSRYDQERFRKEETEGFQIDTMGTYRGISFKSITEGAKPTPQLRQAPRLAPAPQLDNTSVSGRGQKRASRTPIVVVPMASTSLITMYNAKDILQDLKFVGSEEKKSQGTKKENEVLIHRQKDGQTTVPYRIIDNPLKLNSEEWERVVAVFVQGAAWQFKEWPYNNPSDIFSKVCAFHLKWDDLNLDANVSKWAVNVLSLSRTKRHLDRASLIKIWDILDKYMLKNKPFLRF